MPNLPAGLPDVVSNAFSAARDTSIKLQAADTLVTKLTTDLAAANADEANLKIAARDTLRSAEAAFDDFVTGLRANLEAFVAAPADEPIGDQPSGTQPTGDQPTGTQPEGATPAQTNPDAPVIGQEQAGTDPNAL